MPRVYVAMIDKRCESVDEAMGTVADEAVVLIGGQTDSGVPHSLVRGLSRTGASGLHVIVNYPGLGDDPLSELLSTGRVAKVTCSYPRASKAFAEMFKRGLVELEVVPQGTLSERIRAGGAGIPAFYTATSAGTILGEGKQVREFGGRTTVLEYAITADLALIRAEEADRFGNLTYRWAAQNYNSAMATAGDVVVAEVARVVAEPMSPSEITTPGVYVDRVVEVGNQERFGAGR